MRGFGIWSARDGVEGAYLSNARDVSGQKAEGEGKCGVRWRVAARESRVFRHANGVERLQEFGGGEEVQVEDSASGLRREAL